MSKLGVRASVVFWLAEQSGRGAGGIVPNLHLEGAYLREAHFIELAAKPRVKSEQ
jgi:hypothetical protein